MSILRVNKIAASGQTSENTGSVFFDDSGDRLQIASNIDFAFGTGDFTIEYFLYMNAAPTSYFVPFDMRPVSTNGAYPQMNISSSLTLGYYTDATYRITTTLSIKRWLHIAVSRSGTDTKMFVDGAQVGSTYSDSNDYLQSSLTIGSNQYNNDYSIDGYISNFRIVKGKALYTSSFAPPTTELEVTPETVLVACYDGENIFAEKTGKIIAAYGDRLSSPTPTATDSPIGITTFQPGLTRSVDVTAGPVLQGNLEYNSQNFLVLPKGTTTERFPDFGAVDAASARGIFFGGGYSSPTLYDVIDYVTISTTGNAQDFGNLTLARNTTGACSSLTRGVCAGGFDGSSFFNLMDYVTISSTGNAKDFGDLSGIRIHIGGCSNSIRGIFGGGWAPVKNIIDYITISSTGNAFDFGDLTVARFQPASFSSTTRGIFAGGTAPPSSLNNIDYITITSTGNAVDFGDLNNTANATGLSNSTRGLAVITSGSSNAIDFVTIASLGNATDFGDQTVANRELSGSFASSIRGVIGGGSAASTGNVIDYVTIASAGNAQDFGDLTQQRHRVSGCSNGHGGLG